MLQLGLITYQPYRDALALIHEHNSKCMTIALRIAETERIRHSAMGLDKNKGQSNNSHPIYELRKLFLQ